MNIKELKLLQEAFKEDGINYTLKELKELDKNGLLEGKDGDYYEQDCAYAECNEPDWDYLYEEWRDRKMEEELENTKSGLDLDEVKK